MYISLFSVFVKLQEVQDRVVLLAQLTGMPFCTRIYHLRWESIEERAIAQSILRALDQAIFQC
jgi:hypothetical protein